MDNIIQGATSGLGQTAQVQTQSAGPSPVPNPQFRGPMPPTPAMVAPQPPRRKQRRWFIIALIVLLILALLGLFAAFITQPKRSEQEVTNRFDTIQIPLDDFLSGDGLALLGTRNLTINGRLQLNDAFVISPSTQPSNATAGQIYYDQNTSQLAYYNGSEFVTLPGDVTVGQGLSNTNGQLANTGVLSLQGQTGAITLTAGPGIVVDGTTISNSGLLSFAGQTGDITIGSGLSITPDGQLQNSGIVSATGGSGISVTNDGSGNITISNTGAGTGTVQSPGGTPGRIAKFTGVQTIADSLMSETGTTVTVNGDLAVTGSLSLGTPLGVGNGGTGATSLANNGVVIGQGSGALTAVTAVGPGLCFMSTAGAPAFQACPGGGGGVTSLNGLSGALTVANASAAGSTITINDASTSQKGIAQFNSTNFTDNGAGVINTIQDIHVAATPTFGRLTLTSSQATSPMLLVNNTNAGATGNLIDLQLNGASQLSVSPAGNMSLTGTINGQTISSAANFTGTLAVAGNVTANGDLAVNGGDITSTGALNITPGGALTVGATNQSLTLQGNGTTTLSATNAGFTSTLAFQSPTANVTYRLLTAAAGTYDMCTTAGNCVGIGGGVTTPGGTVNRVAKFSSSNGIVDSIITDDGSTVTIGGVLAVNTITPTGPLTIGATGQNLILQGANASLSATGGGFTNTLTFAAPSGSNKTITVPNATGTVAVSATGPIVLDANGNISCPTCGISGSGVTSVNGLSGALTIADASGAGSTITINNASTSQKGIAQFNSTNFTDNGAGTINTIQDIHVGATPTFAGLNITGNTILGDAATDTVTVTAIIQGGTPLVFEGATVDANQLSFAIGALTSDKTVTFGDETGVVCLQGSANCGFATSSGSGSYIQNQLAVDQTGNFRITGTGRANTSILTPLVDTPAATALTLGGTATAVTINENTTINGTATDSLIVKAPGNGTGATILNLQQNGGTSVLRMSDTGTLALGNATTVAGILSIGNGPGTNDAFVEIKVDNVTANQTIQLPNASGTVCLDTNNCTVTLQQAYNVSTIGSEIVLDGTRNAIDIHDRAASSIGTGQNFISLKASAADPQGAGTMRIGFGIGGNIYMRPSNALTVSVAPVVDVRNNTNAGLFVVDQTNNRVGIALGGTGAATLPGFTLDVGGTLNTTGAATFGSTVAVATLGTANTATLLCRNAANQIATCNTTGAGAMYVQGGNSFGATAVLGTNDANSLELETSGTTRLTVGAAGGVTLNVGNALTVTSGATSLTGATSGDALTVSNSTSTGNIAVFKDNTTNVATIADGGATTFQNSTNSANAFRILNAAGTGEHVGVDTTDSILRLLANNTGHLSGTGTNWNTGSSLPAGRAAHATVAANGYLYSIGGCDPGGGATTTVYYARANSDGTVGAWATTTGLPQTMCGGVATTYNGYIYVNGGTGSSATSRDIYYAKPGSDGTISSWATQNDPTNYSVGLKDNGMAAHNGYLYITGGVSDDGLNTENRTVYYGRINADGSVPSFTAQTLWLPANAFNPGETTIANGYLYVFGTANYDKFYYGRINADGSVAASAQSTGVTDPRKYAAIAVLNGYMYVIAGGTTPLATVQYGALANNGDIAAFSADTVSLPAARWQCPKNAPVVNNYIYLIGCANSSDIAQSTVYYAGGSRVKVGGGLDLVGFSGEGLSEGGTGGQLTAGNTFINGGLSVTGNSLLKDGVMVGNVLTVNGVASFRNTTDSTAAFRVLNAAGTSTTLGVDNITNYLYTDGNFSASLNAEVGQDLIVNDQAYFGGSTNNTEALVVYDAGGATLFQVDGLNKRVYVGNPTGDTTGALLVLDTKTNTGDPTGVNGGMYYSTFTNTFRCYENGAWTECLGVPKPNTARTTLITATNNTTDPFSGYGDVLTNVGTFGDAIGGDLVPEVYFDTTTTLNSQAGTSGEPNYNLETGKRYVYQVLLNSNNVGGTTSTRVWSGLTSESLATMAASASPTGDYAAFRYDTGVGDSTYKCVTNNSTTPTVADSGVTPTSNQRKFEILIDNGTRAVFKINGQTVCTITTTLPNETLVRIVNSVTTLTTATRGISVGWVYVQGDSL